MKEQRSDIKQRFDLLKPFLNEKQIRIWTAVESKIIGYGGISTVSRETGFSRNSIAAGCEEMKIPETVTGKRVRRKGGGRKKTVEKDRKLKEDLERLVDPMTRGDPESMLRWTCKSTRKLSDELNRMGHETSHRMVSELLHEMEYSLQANSKTLEGISHVDRNEQFELINRKAMEFSDHGDPVISVDTKKKELVGNFRKPGGELRTKGDPEKVLVHDFMIPELGKVSPYGIYDQARNTGWVNVGTDRDTSAFAVNSIRLWWNSMGHEAYPDTSRLLITADSGGSNGYRVRLWKIELQKLANETGLKISVCHFPPGTSKWNKIEHRLFSFISQNWRGKPLISHQVILDLISSTTTKTGLSVHSNLDKNRYPTGIKISDVDIGRVNIQRDEFHGEWNYTILPEAIT